MMFLPPTLVLILSTLSWADQHNPQPSDITYYLYTRNNMATPEFISYEDSTINPFFDGSKKTVAVVHGFAEGVTSSTWVPTMKDRILAREDDNVILVDWSVLAKDPRYDLAAANTNYTGNDLALLFEDLSSRAGVDPLNVHLVGFSLGSQVVAVTAYHYKTVGRISGLDPARPLFVDKPLSDRLDKDDAVFVDVIHCNSGLLATGHLTFAEPCGHVDFYPNGGHDQRGCASLLEEVITSLEDLTLDEIVACSHMRAPDYFSISIERSDFIGYLCDDYATYQAGSCTGQTNTLGWDANAGLEGLFYMETLVDSPFVASQIKTSFDIEKTTKGSLVLRNAVPGYREDNFTVFSGFQGVTAGDTVATIITASDGGVVAESIFLLFADDSNSTTSLSVSAINAVDVQSGEQSCIGTNLNLPNGIEVSSTPASGSC